MRLKQRIVLTLACFLLLSDLTHGFDFHITNRPSEYTFDPADYRMKTNSEIFTSWAGKWPMYDSNGVAINGGLPQNVDLNAHLDQVEYAVKTMIPDPNWTGYGIFDWESWYPSWFFTKDLYATRTNYYEVQSIAKVRAAHPTWTEQQIEAQAIVEYESAGKIIFSETLKRAKAVRPNVKWGYYGLPLKYYYDNRGGVGYPIEAKAENDRWDWLWQESTALFPSIYLPYRGDTKVQFEANGKFIEQILDETKRAASRAGGRPIYSYIWHHYNNSDYSDFLTAYLPSADMEQQVAISVGKGIDGVILWTASNDAMSEFRSYLDTVMRPIIDKYMPLPTSVFDQVSNHGAFRNFDGLFDRSHESVAVISFFLEHDDSARVDVFDRHGNNVFNTQTGTLAAGLQTSVMWNGRNLRGENVSSGTYLVQIRVSGRVRTAKIVVLK
jgi:hyaluronoglucosaminidase